MSSNQIQDLCAKLLVVLVCAIMPFYFYSVPQVSLALIYGLCRYEDFTSVEIKKILINVIDLIAAIILFINFAQYFMFYLLVTTFIRELMKEATNATYAIYSLLIAVLLPVDIAQVSEINMGGISLKTFFLLVALGSVVFCRNIKLYAIAIVYAIQFGFLKNSSSASDWLLLLAPLLAFNDRKFVLESLLFATLWLLPSSYWGVLFFAFLVFHNVLEEKDNQELLRIGSLIAVLPFLWLETSQMVALITSLLLIGLVWNFKGLRHG